eukprot:364918-Chlamydomonas_euryale.AAC.11
MAQPPQLQKVLGLDLQFMSVFCLGLIWSWWAGPASHEGQVGFLQVSWMAHFEALDSLGFGECAQWRVCETASCQQPWPPVRLQPAGA